MFHIVFLGTGAAIPTRFRNVSCSAMVWNGEIFLFDCGEATQIQLRKAKLKPGRITRIFISHFHGDHLFGLPGLLTSMHMGGCRQTVHLYGPQGLSDYLSFHQQMSKFMLRFPLQIHEVPDSSEVFSWREDGFEIQCRPLAHRMRCLGWAIVEDPRPGKFNVVKAEALRLPHGPARRRLQNGEAVQLADGRTITPEMVLGPARRGHHLAYCVDTAPCENTIHLARGADLLIHDATFDPGEEKSALDTGHSTVIHAAEMAKCAGVRYLALTHISGRYMPHDEPGLLDAARSVFSQTLLAHDLHQISIEYDA